MKTVMSIVVAVLLSVPASAGVWEKQCIDSSGTWKGHYCSLALDARDIPHVAYQDRDFYHLRYATIKNGQWITTVVDTLEHTGEPCSLALDSLGRPHIAYTGQFLGYYVFLKYATLTDTGWTTAIVDSGAPYWSTGSSISIQVDKSGNPCIAYVQSSGYPPKIHMAFHDALGWHLKEVLEANCSTVRLVLEGGSLPLISYDDLISGGYPWRGVIRVARLNLADSSWSVRMMPDSTVVDNLGFDQDQQGNLHILFSSYGNATRYARYDRVLDSWSIDEFPYDLGEVWLKLDRAGVPSVACHNMYGVQFWKKTAGVWSALQVDDWTNPGPYCSLAFDSHNNPRITCELETPDYIRTGLFYYRYWPGAPRFAFAQGAHDFGTVWTQSYSDWSCRILNLGSAPVIINDAHFASYDTIFQIVNARFPITILPGDSGSISVRFKPIADGQYTDTLILATNDSTILTAAMPLQGTGSSSGTSGDLAVQAMSAYIDHEHRYVKADRPLIGSQMWLYQAGQMRYGPLPSTPNGTAQFKGVAIGTYDLTITKTINIFGSSERDTVISVASVTIGPGSNSWTMAVPDSIVYEGYRMAYVLEHLNFKSWDSTGLFSYPAADGVRTLLHNWARRMPTGAAESGARMILADSVVARMFSGGLSIGSEFISDIGELINLINYGDCWANGAKVILKMIEAIASEDAQAALEAVAAYLIEMFVKSYIMEMIGDGIQQAMAQLPRIQIPMSGLTLSDFVMSAWHDIADQYTGANALVSSLPFIGCLVNRQNWSRIKSELFSTMKNLFFEYVYIHVLTDDKVSSATTHTAQFSYNGDFSEAYGNAMEYISSKIQEIQVVKDVSEYSVLTANLMEGTRALIWFVAAIVPGMSWIELADEIAQIGAYGLVLEAMCSSSIEFFTVPGSLTDAVDNIYYPEGQSTGRVNFAQPQNTHSLLPFAVRTQLKRQLLRTQADYDSTLAAVKQSIQLGDKRKALVGLGELTKADRKLRTSMKLAAAPVYALASIARDSVKTFRPMYDTLMSRYAAAGMRRLASCVSLVYYRGEQTQSRKDTVLMILDRSAVANHAVSSHISTMLDSVAALPLGPVLVVCQADQDYPDVKAGRLSTITLQIQNVGGQKADSIRVALRMRGPLRTVEPETVMVAQLTPGQQSGLFTWHVTLTGGGYDRGTWTATILCRTAQSFEYSGVFGTPVVVTPGTGGKLTSSTIYNYPNPFNPDRVSTTLRYSLGKPAQVTIRIYDAGGNLVKTLIEGTPMNAVDEQATPWDGRNGIGDLVANGVYFFVVESSAGERAVGKIAVLR